MLRTGLRLAFFVAAVTNVTVGLTAEVAFRRHLINPSPNSVRVRPSM
jgi:hypothetical protein